jgi:hypothetical protein
MRWVCLLILSLVATEAGARHRPRTDISVTAAHEDPLRNCGDPCVITHNMGGHGRIFIAAAETLAARKKSGAVIDGYCLSACALFADLARAHVCVTRNAVFGFHRSNFELVPPDSADIISWVDAHGGFPRFTSGAVTPMAWPDTLRFWRSCE